MSKARFTKGPWLSPKGSMTKFIDARIGDGMLQEICSVGPTQETDQQLANAHLIASAPEMYDFITGLYESICLNGGVIELGECDCEEMDLLLAKARGEQ